MQPALPFAPDPVVRSVTASAQRAARCSASGGTAGAEPDDDASDDLTDLEALLRLLLDQGGIVVETDDQEE